MKRFEDYARHQRCAPTRSATLAGLKADVERRGGRLHQSERLDELMARIRDAHEKSPSTMIPVPEVGCVVLDCDHAPMGAAYDGSVIAIRGKLLATMSNPVLAFVLAHELAHVALGHVSERRRNHPRLSRLKDLAASLVRPRDVREYQADRLAYQWLRDAGVEEGAWEFFHWLRKEYQRAGRTSEIRGLHFGIASADWLWKHLRTHPSIDERLWQLRAIDPFGEGRAEDAIRRRRLKRARRRSRRKRNQ